MIEEGILALANQATPTLAGRFYADTLPRQVVYPAGIMQAHIAGMASPTFDNNGLQRDRFQFDFAGKSRRDVVTARAALVSALDGFRGLMPNGMWVEEVAYIQPLKLPYDDDKQVFWAGCEFYVSYAR